MDPNAALKEIRAMVSDSGNRCCASCAEHSFVELAEKFEALDEWLTAGGFLPDAWGLTARGVPLTSKED